MKNRLAGLCLTLLIAACAPVSPPSGPILTAPAQVATAPALPTLTPETKLLVPAGAPGTYWVTNPTSGARLFVELFRPAQSVTAPYPTLVLVPGGTGTFAPGNMQRLAREGFLIVQFDPDGRGRSQGVEDYNGFAGQDGLAAVVRAIAGLPEVDTDRLGVVSYSYGVTLAAGALARYPDLPVDFFIDWEGPVSRFYTTVGCTGANRNIQWQPCDDNAWRVEREALTFIKDVRVPYQRIQSASDHVQPTNDHAIEIVNAAVAAGLPWVRLNESSPEPDLRSAQSAGHIARHAGQEPGANHRGICRAHSSIRDSIAHRSGLDMV